MSDLSNINSTNVVDYQLKLTADGSREQVAAVGTLGTAATKGDNKVYLSKWNHEVSILPVNVLGPRSGLPTNC